MFHMAGYQQNQRSLADAAQRKTKCMPLGHPRAIETDGLRPKDSVKLSLEFPSGQPPQILEAPEQGLHWFVIVSRLAANGGLPLGYLFSASDTQGAHQTASAGGIVKAIGGCKPASDLAR